MLDALKKKLGIKPVTPEASEEVETTGTLPEQEKEETMSVEDKAQVELAAHEAVVAELAALKTEMDSFKAAAEAMKAEYEEKLSAYAEAEEKAKADALATKMAARRKAAEATMGTEKASAFMAATEHMDDATFESLCNVFTTNATAEAESEMFQEVGVETKADAQPEPKVEHFNKYLPKKTVKKETK